MSIARRPLAALALALLIPLAPLATTATHTAHAAVVPADGRACSVYAKLRGPFFNGETYQPAPSIDANVNPGTGLVNHHLLYNQPILGTGPMQQAGSINSFDATTINCGFNDSSTVVNTQVGTTITIRRGTAAGASGMFTVGDRITTTFTINGNTFQAQTIVTDATGNTVKSTSNALYTPGSNMLVINNGAI